MNAMVVPPGLEERIEQIVSKLSKKTGNPPGEVRRLVEIAIIQRGVNALEEHT